MSSFGYAALEVDGTFIDAWNEFRFDSDIFTPCDSFRLSLAVSGSSSFSVQDNVKFLRKTFRPGADVKLYVGHGRTLALQATGWIDASDVQNDASGTKFSVEGRDKASRLIADAAPVEIYRKDESIQSFANRACEKHGVTVEGSAVLSRAKAQGKLSRDQKRRLQDQAEQLGIPAAKLSDKLLQAINSGLITPSDVKSALASGNLDSLKLYQMTAKEAKPQSGETVWEFIERHAKRAGALMRMSVDGKLMLTGIDDTQDPRFSIIRKVSSNGGALDSMRQHSSRNNVIFGGERVDTSSVYGRVVVYGRAKGNDTTRSAFKGVAESMTGDTEGHALTLLLHDSSIRSQVDAQRRAEYELAKSRQGMRVLQYTVYGFGQSDAVYTPDTVASVDDDVVGAHGLYYVTGRAFSMSTATGPVTELKLVPKGTIALMGAA